jgi:hypothetical protein
MFYKQRFLVLYPWYHFSIALGFNCMILHKTWFLRTHMSSHRKIECTDPGLNHIPPFHFSWFLSYNDQSLVGKHSKESHFCEIKFRLLGTLRWRRMESEQANLKNAAYSVLKSTHLIFSALLFKLVVQRWTASWSSRSVRNAECWASLQNCESESAF